MPFVPHTKEEVSFMLEEVEMSCEADLFLDMPKDIPAADLSSFASGLDELQLTQQVQQIADTIPDKHCFIGAGAYQHFIPAAVWQIASRGEFLTAYTPYQPEASQGSLQLLYEFQTLITRLLAMEVSNASLYDGATALVEALMMAHRVARGKKKLVIVSSLIHPNYLQVVQTFCDSKTFEIQLSKADAASGITDTKLLEQQLDQARQQNIEVLAVVVAQPNFLGSLENVDCFTDAVHAAGAQLIALVNPLAMSLLKPPGEWGQKGADIVCGDAQPLGMPLSLGGPYAGFLCCRQRDVRQLPGRLVGRTYDKQGRCGYTLTLQAREQHIRRAKAKSNICTNQGLQVVAATIYMSLLGGRGMQKVISLSHKNACQLRSKLISLPNVRPLTSAPFLYEFVIQCDVDIEKLLYAMDEKGISAGISLQSYSVAKLYPRSILVCVTEMITTKQINNYVKLFSSTLQDL